MVYRMKDSMEKAAPLFKGWKETVILSCLQGVMGELYVDDVEHPHSAMAVLGDFCFFAGTPMEELVAYRSAGHESDFMIMVPENPAKGVVRAHGANQDAGVENAPESTVEAVRAAEEVSAGTAAPNTWGTLIEAHYGDRAKKTTRYAIKKEAGVFDREKLEEIVASLPQEYTLKLIDEELYHRCLQEKWSRDFVAQYSDYAVFEEHGLGVAALDGATDELLSAASSYSAWEAAAHPISEGMNLGDSVLTGGGIEIEIATEKEHRRKGLALVCGAKLLLECIERGLYPSWDAHNPGSVALSEKLGYHYECDYDVYEIYGY